MTALAGVLWAMTMVLVILIGLMAYVAQFVLIRLAYRHFPGAIARWQLRRLMRIATDVEVDPLDLAHKEFADDLLLLVQRHIAQESQLLGWKAIRLAEQARRDGLPEEDAALIIENLERYRIANAETLAGVSFIGFLIPDDSPLMRHDATAVRKLNRRMRQLTAHWIWTGDWLWQYRKTVKTPE